MTGRIGSYSEFWPYYLGEHRKPATRALHLFGTGLGLVMLTLGLTSLDWRLMVAAVVVGYGFAWIGHAAVEHSQPATFRHPLWSRVSDLRTFFLWLAGRMSGELERHGMSRASLKRGPNRDLLLRSYLAVCGCCAVWVIGKAVWPDPAWEP